MATATPFWFSQSHNVPHSETSNGRTINEYRIEKGVKGSGQRVTYIISKNTLRERDRKKERERERERHTHKSCTG
jgi:hypothetical protein